jgi:hypothetical protein
MSIDDQENIQDERREFFRIDDSIRVSYRVISAAEIPTSIDEQLRAGERFTVMTRLQEISQHLSASMHRIEQRDADIADYLKALDEKINLLGRSFLTEARELLDQPSQQVNLSAGDWRWISPKRSILDRRWRSKCCYCLHFQVC